MSHNTYPYDLWNTPPHLLTEEQKEQLMQESKLNSSIPRRAQMQEWTTEEKELFHLMQEIEKLGGSVKLTKCITLLSEARDALADHIEGIE